MNKETVKKQDSQARRDSGDILALRALSQARQEAYQRGDVRKRIVSSHRLAQEDFLRGRTPLGADIVTPNPTQTDVASGPRPSWRDPHPLQDVLSAFVREAGWKSNVDVGSLAARWDKIVGSTVAQHCPIESFDDGVLILRASSVSWQTQIRTLLATVQSKIDMELGVGVVQEVKVLAPYNRSNTRGRNYR